MRAWIAHYSRVHGAQPRRSSGGAGIEEARGHEVYVGRIQSRPRHQRLRRRRRNFGLNIRRVSWLPGCMLGSNINYRKTCLAFGDFFLCLCFFFLCFFPDL